jgi:hypothetical protein
VSARREGFWFSLISIIVVSVSSGKSEIRKIHLGLVLAELVCLSAFVIEILRALGGNDLSWAYVFEWPFFGAYALYMWRKLLASERSERNDQTSVADVPDDPELIAWNAYLAQVHAAEYEKDSKKPTE